MRYTSGQSVCIKWFWFVLICIIKPITILLLCQEFNETATMLSATCDEFLKNLFDCMELADTTFGKIFGVNLMFQVIPIYFSYFMPCHSPFRNVISIGNAH